MKFSQKMRYSFILALFGAFIPFQSQAKAPRTLEISPGMVSEVHTSIGYSTIVEFVSKPTQAVLGDQDAFKLEYIGNSITLKPLLPRSKSNLFVFTDQDRYSFSVDTVQSGQGDYLVKVRNKFFSAPIASERKTKSINIHRRVSKSGVTVELHRLDLSLAPTDPREASIITFDLFSEKNHYTFQPSSIGVKQGTRFVSIENIYLDALEIGPEFKKVRGTLVLLNEDWDRNHPLTFVFALRPLHPQKKDFRIESYIWGGQKKGAVNDDSKISNLFKTKTK